MLLLGPVGHQNQVITKIGAPVMNCRRDVLEDEVIPLFPDIPACIYDNHHTEEGHFLSVLHPILH